MQKSDQNGKCRRQEAEKYRGEWDGKMNLWYLGDRISHVWCNINGLTSLEVFCSTRKALFWEVATGVWPRQEVKRKQLRPGASLWEPLKGSIDCPAAPTVRMPVADWPQQSPRDKLGSWALCLHFLIQ